MKNLSQVLSVITLITILINGCVNPREFQNKSDSSDSAPYGYPSPRSEINPLIVYPPPVATITTAEISALKVLDPPTPDPELGSISGLLLNGIQNIFMKNAQIYLLHVGGSDTDRIPPVLVGYQSKNGDIAGRTESDGQFVFQNVPPGNYFIIFSMDLSPIFSSPNSVQPVIIKVSDGDMINLGVVYYLSR